MRAFPRAFPWRSFTADMGWLEGNQSHKLRLKIEAIMPPAAGADQRSLSSEQSLEEIEMTSGAKEKRRERRLFAVA